MRQFEIIMSNSPHFPVRKFERLMRLEEVRDPQTEDGQDFSQWSWPGPRQGEVIFVILEGSRAMGFAVLNLRGLHCIEFHGGFRPKALTGEEKKSALLGVFALAFPQPAHIKLVGMIPAFNMPARILARSMGVKVEGRIKDAFKKGGKFHDILIYGATRDELLKDVETTQGTLNTRGWALKPHNVERMM